MRKTTATVDTGQGPVEVPAIEVTWDLGDGPEPSRFLRLPARVAFPDDAPSED